MMTLHHSQSSPYVRKVMILLHETEQLDTVALAPAMGTPVDPGSLPVASNPLGKIPALERSDGCTLYDSRVITRFLAERPGATTALYPDGPRLWEVLTLEATADGILDAALLARYETALRPETQQSPAWIDGQMAKITRALDALEARWLGHLAGPICMGQIAVACALGYLDFRFVSYDWRAANPSLAAWYAGFSERPSMQATQPPAS